MQTITPAHDLFADRIPAPFTLISQLDAETIENEIRLRYLTRNTLDVQPLSFCFELPESEWHVHVQACPGFFSPLVMESYVTIRDQHGRTRIQAGYTSTPEHP